MTITELLDEYGVRYLSSGDHHCRSGWIQMECPFCGPGSGKYHLGFNLSAGYFSCWVCRGHGLVTTLSHLIGEDYGKCAELAKGIESISTDTWDDARREQRNRSVVIPKGVRDLSVLPLHRRYLSGRGFDYRTLAHQWGVRGVAQSKRISWRVFIPITLKGEVVSWTARSIKDGRNTIRYISASPEEERRNHKTLLYGEDNASHAVCVMEGPADCWRFGCGGVALFGTSYTIAQVRRIARFPVRAICFDNEPNAQSMADQLVDSLSAFSGETFKVTLDSKDMGEASPKEIRKVRKLLGLSTT